MYSIQVLRNIFLSLRYLFSYYLIKYSIPSSKSKIVLRNLPGVGFYELGDGDTEAFTRKATEDIIMR